MSVDSLKNMLTKNGLCTLAIRGAFYEYNFKLVFHLYYNYV